MTSREPVSKSKRAPSKRKPKSKAKKDWMDEDDIDDFLDDNGDSEDAYSGLYLQSEMIYRGKSKRSTRSRPSVKKEKTDDTFKFNFLVRTSVSSRKTVKRRATKSPPAK